MSSELFEIYQKEKYLDWHKNNVENRPLEKFLMEFRENLKDTSEDKIKTLGQLLTQIKQRTEPECKLQSKGMLSGEFELPTKQFSRMNSQENYDLLFKSIDSIIEKCWRKNVTLKSDFVSSENITKEISDLIRTSVVCPTLLHAKMFAERFEAWEDFIPKEDLDKHFSDISRIIVDKEAKPASGYFAYHAQVFFSSEISIEVQLFSQLSSAWRNLAHKLYETSRIKASPFNVPGSPETRLISLGHMLHLAECELDRLAFELKDKFNNTSS
jgi:ppGpp synthetase/RelA/SpoT-type nucleotidyltranferase